MENSNLPGPRGNLELAYAVADIYRDQEIIFKWINISANEADVNSPRSFLAFCGAVCLGNLYLDSKNKKFIFLLKNLANDSRWRMREAVAFAFQRIGEEIFEELRDIFSDWIDRSNNYEKRAILVSLAHPKFLDKEKAEFCFDITVKVLNGMDRENDFEVLRKGLDFTISVFVAANPEKGFDFIRKWLGKDKVIDRILIENLKKNRLAGKYPEEVDRIFASLG